MKYWKTLIFEKYESTYLSNLTQASRMSHVHISQVKSYAYMPAVIFNLKVLNHIKFKLIRTKNQASQRLNVFRTVSWTLLETVTHESEWCLSKQFIHIKNSKATIIIITNSS